MRDSGVFDRRVDGGCGKEILERGCRRHQLENSRGERIRCLFVEGELLARAGAVVVGVPLKSPGAKVHLLTNIVHVRFALQIRTSRLPAKMGGKKRNCSSQSKTKQANCCNVLISSTCLS